MGFIPTRYRTVAGPQRLQSRPISEAFGRLPPLAALRYGISSPDPTRSGRLERSPMNLR